MRLKVLRFAWAGAWVRGASDFVPVAAEFMRRSQLQLLRINGLSDEQGVVFVTMATEAGRFEMQGLAEDYSRKKLTHKKGQQLRHVADLGGGGEAGLEVALFVAVALPEAEGAGAGGGGKRRLTRKLSKVMGKGGRGLYDPCWNSGSSCWQATPRTGAAQ